MATRQQILEVATDVANFLKSLTDGFRQEEEELDFDAEGSSSASEDTVDDSSVGEYKHPVIVKMAGDLQSETASIRRGVEDSIEKIRREAMRSARSQIAEKKKKVARKLCSFYTQLLDQLETTEAPVQTDDSETSDASETSEDTSATGEDTSETLEGPSAGELTTETQEGAPAGSYEVDPELDARLNEGLDEARPETSSVLGVDDSASQISGDAGSSQSTDGPSHELDELRLG
jgi:hypothetical protein